MVDVKKLQRQIGELHCAGLWPSVDEIIMVPLEDNNGELLPDMLIDPDTAVGGMIRNLESLADEAVRVAEVIRGCVR